MLSVDSTVFDPLRSKSSFVTETMGLAESKSGRAMREPVTITCSMSSSWADTVAQTKQSAATSAIGAGSLTVGGVADRRVSGMLGSNQDIAASGLRANRPPKPAGPAHRPAQGSGPDVICNLF